jgi:hypothetical protein
MKLKKNPVIQLNLPEIQGNRLVFSWDPNVMFKEAQYWVEYPDLEKIEASEGKRAEALFPLCLAFAALGARVKLPVKISEEVLSHWRQVIQIAAFQCFRPPVRYSISNGTAPANYRPYSGKKTVLCFGGGTESLLSLGLLMNEGVRPILASFGGPNWSGSDPEKNPDKFRMDETVSQELQLPLLRVRTNFRAVMNAEAWRPYLKKDISMLNTVLLLPFFISFLVPAAETFHIRRIINGNEKMNFPKEYFCFSPAMTGAYGRMAEGTEYESYLGHLYKEEVCRELYLRYPQLARYQYSCWRNEQQRWCYRCESCMEYFALLKKYGLDPNLIGLEESRIRANRSELVAAVSRAQESRPGEIWGRMWDNSVLREDAFMRDFLDEARKKAEIYHAVKRVYDEVPRWIKAIYRSQKKMLKRLEPQKAEPLAQAA